MPSSRPGAGRSSSTAREPPGKRSASAEREGAGPLAHLHASAGNAAVSRLLRGEVEARDRLEAIRGELQRPGRELDPETRAQMEADLGRELPPVRVHDDAGAARAAKAANATAFTHGSDVVLGAGVAPLSSSDGRRVLAHELVHVIQQAHAPSRSLGLVPPGARAEQQAQGGAAPVAPAAAGGVARLVEKDLARLTEAELPAEYQLVRTYLADQPPGPDYDAGAAYIREIEQQMSSRAGPASLSGARSTPSPAAIPTSARAASLGTDARPGGASGPAAPAGVAAPTRTSHTGAGVPRGSAEAAAPHATVLSGPAPEHELVRRLNAAWTARHTSAALGGLGLPAAKGGSFAERARAQAFDRAERALLAPTDADLLELSDQLIRAFQQNAYEVAMAQLASNEEIAKAEAGHYDEVSSGDPSTQANRLRDAAGAIGIVQDELLRRIAEISGGLVEEASHPRVTATTLDEYLDAPILQGDPTFQALRLRYETLKRIYGTTFPVLLRKGTDYQALQTSNAAQLERQVEATTGDVLEKISRTRERLTRSPELTWSLAPIVELTKEAMGIRSSSYALYVIEQYRDGQEKEDAFVNTALAALGLTLAAAGIVTTLATGGAAAPAGAAAVATAEALSSIALATAGLSVFGAIVQYEEYAFRHGAAGASLDPAQALSADDPSLFWLAVALLAVVLDLGATVVAFRNLAAVARAVKTTEELAAFEEAVRAQANVLRQQGKLKSSEDEFIGRVMAAARERLAKQGGAAKIGSVLDEAVDTVEKAHVVANKPPVAIVRGREVPPHDYGGGYHAPGEQTPPDVAFQDGLPARGDDLRIQQHVMPYSEDPTPASTSGFRGTTELPSSPPEIGQGAAYWAEDGQYIYQIEGVATWNTEKALEGQIRLPDGSFTQLVTRSEVERVILARVPPERIVRAGRVTVADNGAHYVSEWIPNPNFKPRP